VFSPGIWWIGSMMNRSGSDASGPPAGVYIIKTLTSPLKKPAQFWVKINNVEDN
jgi:hypothetical protein